MLIWTTRLDWSNRLEVPVACFLARCFQRQRLLPMPRLIRGTVDRVNWLSHRNMIHHCYRFKMGTMPSWLTCQSFSRRQKVLQRESPPSPDRPALHDFFPFTFAEIFSVFNLYIHEQSTAEQIPGRSRIRRNTCMVFRATSMWSRPPSSMIRITDLNHSQLRET